MMDLFCPTTDESYMSMEELNLPTDLKDLPFRMNWNAELPTNISVPRVDLHSLILDFSALKGLKM
eukprot:superscaffoldBa00004396_g18808